MTALPPLLSVLDLPAAELAAMRLDGELFTLEGAYSPVDLPIDPAARARSLAPLCGGRLIVELTSAAWVWGAVPAPPLRHQLCSSLGARARPVEPALVVVREVVIGEEEWVALGGVRVTTPIRTVMDLARAGAAEDVVRAVLAHTGISVGDSMAIIAGRKGLPNKRRALALLGGL